MTAGAARTIFALSSGAPPAAIAIVRISGPDSQSGAATLGAGDLPSRRPVLRALHDPATAELLDRALVLFFPAASSATGEDVVELHLHGGRAIVRAVEQVLLAHPGLRPADAGEFTRRAVLNGRLDLLEAEALGDLLAAETDAQRRQASRAAPYLKQLIDGFRRELIELSATLEAAIDHDEEVGEVAWPRAQVEHLGRRITDLLARPAAERLRDGFLVVLAGPPNAGKSTLFNALAGREAAIVSDEPGTTRDVVELPLRLHDLAIRLCDTAGQRDGASGAIERIGIDRARDLCEAADLVLWLSEAPFPFAASHLLIRGKADLPGRAVGLAVSGRTGAGLEQLRSAIRDHLAALLPPEGEALLQERQRRSLAAVAAYLDDALAATEIVLVAEALRSALSVLDQLTGRSGFEEVMDSIFGRFCLGK